MPEDDEEMHRMLDFVKMLRCAQSILGQLEQVSGRDADKVLELVRQIRTTPLPETGNPVEKCGELSNRGKLTLVAS